MSRFASRTFSKNKTYACLKCTKYIVVVIGFDNKFNYVRVLTYDTTNMCIYEGCKYLCTRGINHLGIFPRLPSSSICTRGHENPFYTSIGRVGGQQSVHIGIYRTMSASLMTRLIFISWMSFH